MENKLFFSLQKTGRWMFVVGIIMSIFNLILGGIVIGTIQEFIRDGGRLLPGVLCLFISAYAGILAIKTAMTIKEYIREERESTLELLFKYEATFWNCLIAMVLVAVITLALIIMRII